MRYNFKVILTAVIVLTALLSVTLPAYAGEIIVAEGVAAVYGGNTAVARDKAIDDALRKAVEQAVGAVVSSDTLSENFKVIHDKIIAQTAGYVEKHKILSEKADGNLYRVRIQAEIGRANLMNDIRALGLLHVLKEKPKVMVIIDEQVMGLFGRNDWENVGEAESIIIEKFLNAGFNVVDPEQVRKNIDRDGSLKIFDGDAGAAEAAGLKHGAQIIIAGKAFSKNAVKNIRGTNMQSIHATLQARVYRTDNGKVISSRSETATQVHIDEMQGGALAIKEAGAKLADNLIQDIISQWRGEVYGRSQEITLIISGLTSYRHLTVIKRFLEKETQGVKAVHQKGFTAGIAELTLDYGGKSSNIADNLANREFPGFNLDPTNVTPNRVDVKVILE